MINGLVLFAKTGGTALALEDSVRPVAYYEPYAETREFLFSCMVRGGIPSAPCCDTLNDMRRELRDEFKDIDVVHGSLPTEAEYARLVKRELGEKPRNKTRDRGYKSDAGRNNETKVQEENLYEQIYELAKEVQPKFLFFEIRLSDFRRINRFDVKYTKLAGNRNSLSEQERESYDTLSLSGRFVQSLSELGYDCRWDTLSAYDVGSPQKRERIYLLARKRGRDCRENKSDMGRGREISTDTFFNPFGKPTDYSGFERTPERMAEVIAGLDEVCVPQYREAFLRLSGLKIGRNDGKY